MFGLTKKVNKVEDGAETEASMMGDMFKGMNVAKIAGMFGVPNVPEFIADKVVGSIIEHFYTTAQIISEKTKTPCVPSDLSLTIELVNDIAYVTMDNNGVVVLKKPFDVFLKSLVSSEINKQ